MEAPAHFEIPITRLIVISKYRDDNVKLLEEKYGKKGIFLTAIPLDLESLLCKGTYVLIDDMEDVLSNDKDVQKMILKAAFFWIHHIGIFMNIVYQSYNLFYASSKLHQIVYQANALILFRTSNLFGMVKKVLNSYNVNLKSGDSLYSTFKDYCSGKKNRYIIILVHPKLDSPVVASSILYDDPDPYIVFT